MQYCHLPPTSPEPTLERQELRQRVEAHPFWYHTIDIADSVATPGWFDLRPIVERMPWPDVRGKRCLDIGTYDGYLAFELERRGAAEVVAIDVEDHLLWDWPPDFPAADLPRDPGFSGPPKGAGFRLAKELLGSKVDWRPLSIYDLDPADIGTFDVVVLGSLLLHLRDPLRALAAVKRVTDGFFLSADQIELGLTLRGRHRPLYTLNGSGGDCQWFTCNAAGHERLVYAAGFEVVERSKPYVIRFNHHPSKMRVSARLLARKAATRLLTGDGGSGVLHQALLTRPRVWTAGSIAGDGPTVLVTGAGGHIGQRLVHRLAADGGVSVRALVRSPLGWPAGVEQVVGDLVEDPSMVAAAAKGVDVVIHLAGANEADMRADADGALARSLAAAKAVAGAGCPRAIYLSTVHVYGSALVPGAVVTETTAAAPTSAYATARLTCEDMFARSATPTMVVRMTNGIGAPMRPDSAGWTVVAHELCRDGVTKGRLTLKTPGLQWRDFVPLVDVESALSAVVRGDVPEGVFNFGSGHSVTVRALAAEIQESFLRVSGQPLALEMPAAEGEAPAAYRVDISAIQALRLFSPTPRTTALDALVQYCLDHRAALT